MPADPKCLHKNFASTVRIAEPPGIEGFAIVAAPNQRSQRVYLSTRLNLLFRTRPTLAHAPDPPLQVHNAMNNPAAVVLAPFIAGMATLAQPDRKKRERIWSPIARSVLRDRSRENRKRRDWALQSLNLTEVADQTFGKPHNHDDEFDDHAANCDGNQMLEYLEMVEKKRGFLQVSDAQGYVQLSEIVAVDPELEANDREAAGLDDRTRSRKLRTLTVKFNSGVTAKLEVSRVYLLSIGSSADWRSLGFISVLRTRSATNGSPACEPWRLTGPVVSVSTPFSTWSCPAPTRWSVAFRPATRTHGTTTRKVSKARRNLRSRETRCCRVST